MIFLTQEEGLPAKRHNLSLLFYRDDMPFYSKLLNVFSNLETRYPQISFYAIDANHFAGLCKRFVVENVPQLLVFQEEKEVKRSVQTVCTKDFVDIFADICIF